LGNKVCVLVGTRPGIVKMSPIIRAFKSLGANLFLIHSGQHYSLNMDTVFFDELGLDRPEHRADTKEESLPGEQTADMLRGIEKALLKENPQMLLVGGDANTNLAGALAARKLHIQVGHVEAGLRSHDWRMPEEHNRIMIDHISEYLFAPTESARENLIRDNVQGKIFVTGNTIVDAVNQNLELASSKSNILERLSLSTNGYFLVTCHREENVDHKDRLKNILESLELILQNYEHEVIFPVHPRTEKRLREFGLKLSDVRLIEPVGYLDFLKLEANAKLILTDSGGIQEEACIMRIPCVTLRESTERPETVQAGSNIVAGLTPQTILAAVEQMVNKNREWKNPFGDGRAGERIAKVCLEELE